VLQTPKAIFCCCVLLVASADADANNVTWVKDADGSWTTASNWSSNPALPGANDDVTIDVPGDRLISLAGTQSVRNATIRERFSMGTGTLNLGGTLLFDNAANFRFGGTIKGGTLQAGPNGALTVISLSLDNVTVNAPLNVLPMSAAAQGLGSDGSLVLNSTINVGSEDGTVAGSVNFGSNHKPSGSLSGNGAVHFGSFPGFGYNELRNFSDLGGDAGTLSIGPGITIDGGWAQICNVFDSGTIVNRGTILADHDGSVIVFGSFSAPKGTLVNDGSMIVKDGGVLYLYGRAGRPSVGGTITLGDGGLLNLGGGISQASMGTLHRTGGTVTIRGLITGDLALNAQTGSWEMPSGTLSNGTFSALDGANLAVSSGTLINETIAAGTTLTVQPSSDYVTSNLYVQSGLTVNGMLVAKRSQRSNVTMTAQSGAGPITLGGTGTVILDGELINQNGTLTIDEGLTISGRGSIYSQSSGGTIINRGTIAATLNNPITVSGNYGYNYGHFINAGVLLVEGGMTANELESDGGAIKVTTGRLTLGGAMTQADLGTLVRSGGTVSITGTFSGGLSLDAGTGSWELNAGTLKNGIYSARDGTSLLATGDCTLDGMTIAAGTVLNAAAGASMTIPSALTLNGTINGGYIDAVSATISGTGEIATGSISARIIGSGIVVHGKGGSVTVSENNGSILADTAGGTVYFNSTNATNNGLISTANGGLLSITYSLASIANHGTLQADGGTFLMSAGSLTNDGTLVARAGTLQIGTAVALDMKPTSKLLVSGSGVMKLGGHSGSAASIDVSDGGRLQMEKTATASAVLTTSALTITGSGKLDLANNRLVVDYDPAAASPITSVRAALVSGCANGAWNGPGIDSAGIAAGRSLGYAEAADVLGTSGGSFGAATVDGSAVLVRYTLSGDATLDGAVDFNDLVNLAQNYNTATVEGSGWYRGDFNYDGTVDFNDLVKLAQNYNAALPGEPIAGVPSDFAGDLAAAFASVPEPSSLSFLAAGVLLAVRRRRQTV
jgi:hypothetical protein